MRKALDRVAMTLLAGFVAVALGIGYWGAIRAPALTARDDNPRRIEFERSILRGRIVDRDGEVLAATEPGADGMLRRSYPHPEAAGAVGYYSLRHGVGGVEAAFDSVLRGDEWLDWSQALTNRLLHRSQVGGDVRLTLDLELQRLAGELLDGRIGAAVMVSVPDGQVLAMFSAPSYDPNRLEDEWDALSDAPDAPLLNRVTQGQYQPGAALESIILGAALELWPDALEEVFPGGNTPVNVNHLTIGCVGDAPDEITGAGAYALTCPAPFVEFCERLGPNGLDSALERFGLYSAPPFDLGTEMGTRPPVPETPDDLIAACLGQGGLVVSPLQMVELAATLANGGEAVPLHLAEAIRRPGGEWESVSTAVPGDRPITSEALGRLHEAMLLAVESGTASPAARPGIRIFGHAGLAWTGPEERALAWFLGFTPSEDGAFAVAVVLEGEDDPGQAARVGGTLLNAP